jgi:hypothetical protein
MGAGFSVPNGKRFNTFTSFSGLPGKCKRKISTPFWFG